MSNGKPFIVTVTILTMFLTVVSISFTDKETVFAQSSLFGNDNGGLVGNMLRNFGNVVGNLGISNLNTPSTTTPSTTTPSTTTPSTTTPSTTTPNIASQPFTGLFGNTPTGTTNITPDDKNRILSSLFGTPAAAPAAPAAAPATTAPTDNDNNGQHFIDKPCHPGRCLGTPGWYTVEGHHHCYEGTRDCIHTSHFHDEHYK